MYHCTTYDVHTTFTGYLPYTATQKSFLTCTVGVTVPGPETAWTVTGTVTAVPYGSLATLLCTRVEKVPHSATYCVLVPPNNHVVMVVTVMVASVSVDAIIFQQAVVVVSVGTVS